MKTTPCEKCKREIGDNSKTHYDFCDKVPPPTKLKKCRRMSIYTMSRLWGVAQSSLKSHFEELGIELSNGKACLNCGLKVTVQARQQHKRFCDKLYSNLEGTAFEARQTLQVLVKTNTIEKLAGMYGVSYGSLNKHMENLYIQLPSYSERNKQFTLEKHKAIIANLEVSHEKIQESLTYFSMSKVADELGFKSTRGKAIFKIMGLRCCNKKEIAHNKREYKKKYGKQANLYAILYDMDTDYNKCHCKRCEMVIYEDTNSLPPLSLVMDAKGNHNRTLPSFINRWTQLAIPFNMDINDKRWKRRKNITTGKRQWMFFDSRVQEFYLKGELLCRFCIADLKGKPHPLPPEEYISVSDVSVETTTDDDGNIDDFADDFDFNDEVIYA